MYTACDCIGMCKYITPWLGTGFGLVPREMAELFSLATGVEMDERKMVEISDRVYNLERAFLVREGVTRRDDYPPARFMEEPIPSGPNKGDKIDGEKYDEMLNEYYALRGWTSDGVPTQAKLKELGLNSVADELKRLGK